MHSLMIVCRDEVNMVDSIGWFRGCHEVVFVWMSVYLTPACCLKHLLLHAQWQSHEAVAKLPACT